MRILAQKDDSVVIDISPNKAQDLLDGLIAHEEELGELGRELVRRLLAAGVRPSVAAEQPRYEYMPPLQP